MERTFQIVSSFTMIHYLRCYWYLQNLFFEYKAKSGDLLFLTFVRKDLYSTCPLHVYLSVIGSFMPLDY